MFCLLLAPANGEATSSADATFSERVPVVAWRARAHGLVVLHGTFGVVTAHGAHVRVARVLAYVGVASFVIAAFTVVLAFSSLARH